MGVKRTAFRSCLVTVLACAYPTVALAQEATDNAANRSDAESRARNDEIIVTAERRSQSLQRLPTAASVIGGDDLDRQQVVNVDDLVTTTPSFTVNDIGVAKSISIRGVGKSVNAPGVQAGVGYYVDGVAIPNDLFLTTPFFDLARVELLRGPQGTLVGMNSTGGAVLIVSANPNGEAFEGSFEQTVGNYDALRTRGVLNVPFGGGWGLRVAGEFEKRDSFFTNVSPGTGEPGNVNRLGLRGTLGGSIGSDVELYLRGEYVRSRTDGTFAKPVPGDPSPAYLPLYAASPSDPYSLSRDFPTYYDTTYYRISGELKWAIGDLFQLRSITAYQNGQMRSLLDFDSTRLSIEEQEVSVDEPVFSQEVNLISLPGGKLDWVLGYIYQRHDTNGFVDVRLRTPRFSLVNINSPLRTRTQGVFGQATLHATDAFNITAGLRYNHVRHFNAAGGRTIVGGGALTIPMNGRAEDEAVTGRLTLDYQLSADHFAYATISRGFKAGGLNSDSTSFGPEFIWNYEAGLKSTLFDRTIRTQLAVFHYRNSAVQLQVFSPLTPIGPVRNIGKGEVIGVEFQGSGSFGAFSANVAASYTDTKFDPVTLLDPRFGNNVNIGGRPYLFSPKFTFNAGAEYAAELGGGYTLTPRVQYSHLSSQWASVFQVRQTDFIEARDLVDASIRIDPADKGWSAEVYVTNLFDETYVASKDVTNADLTRRVFYGAPRQIGVRLGYSF